MEDRILRDDMGRDVWKISPVPFVFSDNRKRIHAHSVWVYRWNKLLAYRCKRQSKSSGVFWIPSFDNHYDPPAYPFNPFWLPRTWPLRFNNFRYRKHKSGRLEQDWIQLQCGQASICCIWFFDVWPIADVWRIDLFREVSSACVYRYKWGQKLVRVGSWHLPGFTPEKFRISWRTPLPNAPWLTENSSKSRSCSL